MDIETGKLIASLISIGDESVGKTLTAEERADAKKRISEVFAKSGKKFPRKTRQKPDNGQN